MTNIKHIITAFIAIFFPLAAQSEDSLEGTWVSSLSISKAHNDLSNMPRVRVEFIEQIVGTLELTYSDTEIHYKDSTRKIVLDGKDSVWHGENGSFPYLVLKRSGNVVRIKTKWPDGSWRKYSINFEGQDTYWIDWRETSQVDFKEYFVRKK